MKIEDRTENMEKIAAQMREQGKSERQIESHFRDLARTETALLAEVLAELNTSRKV